MRNKITSMQKALIVHSYIQEKKNQTVLAQEFNVSRRTIQRVLLEKGAIAVPGQLTQDEQQMLDMCKANNLNPFKLRQVFNAPTLTLPNIRQYLEQLSLQALGQLFYAVHMSKVHQENLLNQNKKEGTPHAAAS